MTPERKEESKAIKVAMLEKVAEKLGGHVNATYDIPFVKVAGQHERMIVAFQHGRHVWQKADREFTPKRIPVHVPARWRVRVKHDWPAVDYVPVFEVFFTDASEMVAWVLARQGRTV